MLFINEWRLYVRQPVVWVSLLAMLGFSALLVQGLSVADSQLDKRITMLNISLIMLTLPVMVGALTPSLFQRDSISHMHELIGAAKASGFTRRFYRLTAFLTLVYVICLSALVLQLLMLSLHPMFSVALLFTALKNVLLIVLPACLLYCALAIRIATHVSNALPVYVFFALLWIGYVVLSSMTGSPILAGSNIVHPMVYKVMLIADPLGVTPVFDQFSSSRTDWLPNSTILLNRISWLTLSTIIIWFALTKPCEVNPQKNNLILEGMLEKSRLISSFRGPTAVFYHPLVALVVVATKTLLASRVNGLILVIFGGVIFSEVMAGISYAERYAVISPESIDALNRVVWDILPFAGCILMALWSWQLGWQNQRNGASELIAATPIGNVQLVTSQAVSLFIALFALLSVTAIAISVAQVLTDSLVLISAYAQLLTMTGLPILLFGWLCIAIHHIFRSALAAGGICLLLLVVKFTPILSFVGITHPLLDIAGTPLQPADYLIGFSRSLHTFEPYLLVWFAVTLCGLWIAVNKTHRGTGFVLRAWRALPWSGWVAFGLVITLFLGFHLALKQARPAMTPNVRYALRADYETQYGYWQQRTQPVVRHIDAEVDFYPEQRRAVIGLSMSLQNMSNEDINEVLIGSYPGFKPTELALSKARLRYEDAQLQQSVYKLDSPLLPGQTLTLYAKVVVKGTRMWLPDQHNILLPEFSYLRGVPLLPNVGFNQTYALRDPARRAKLGLPPLTLPKPSQFASSLPPTDPNSRPITVHSVVSSPLSHTVVAQGQRVKQWQNSKRRYVEFATKAPIRNVPVWAATVQSNSHHLIMIDEHDVDVNLTGIRQTLIQSESTDAEKVHLQAVQDTFKWFADQLKPYPYRQISLVFIPEVGLSGYALPQVILLSHRLAVRARPTANAGFDQRYRRAVHEAAHQWFGHQIGYGVNADGSFLIESLAKYAELVLIEQRFGNAAMQSLVDYELNRYQYALRDNTTTIEAMIDATNSPDVYSRATLVFARLRSLVGDKPIVAALNQLFEQNAPGEKSVTSMDFVTFLLAEVRVEHQEMVKYLLLSSDIDTLLTP